MAATGSQYTLSEPARKERKNTAAAEAPPVMPMMSGEAKGLRIKLCNIRPDTAKAAPTMKAITMRGKRKVSSTKA